MQDDRNDVAGVGMKKAVPKFRDIKLIDSGWLNKYVLTYELADGSLYEYEAVSRKGLDDYRRMLEHNGNTAVGDHVVEDENAVVSEHGVASDNNAAGENGITSEHGATDENTAASESAVASENNVAAESSTKVQSSTEAQSTAEAQADIEIQSDAVCIIPFLRDGSILLIKEFRYPVNGWVVAFPAGLIDPGEDIADCVNRELGEETGFRLRRDVEEPVRFFAQSGFSSVGMSDENVRVVVAQVEDAGEQNLQAGELIERFVLPRRDIGRFLDTNRDFIGTRCQLVLEALRESGNILGSA